MKDYIVLNLSYPVKFLGIRFFKSRNIGFLFTNLSMFLFRENCELKTSKDYERWIEANGQARFINEMLFASAQAYSMQIKIKQNFTKHGLAVALTQANEKQQTELMTKWSNSQTFGMKQSEKKKTLTKR